MKLYEKVGLEAVYKYTLQTYGRSIMRVKNISLYKKELGVIYGSALKPNKKNTQGKTNGFHIQSRNVHASS